MRNIETGLVAEDSVNAAKAKKVGIDVYTFKINRQVTPLWLISCVSEIKIRGPTRVIPTPHIGSRQSCRQC